MFKRPCGGIVVLSDSVLDTFADFTQVGKDDPEAGGILLGRLIIDSEDVVIDEATKPAPEDRRSRFYFRRSNKPALRRVTEAWETSGGTQVYLGDWHYASRGCRASVVRGSSELEASTKKEQV
jgi:integrative and conjugative element protein (TIGR02256 family)